jgi:cytochrome c1
VQSDPESASSALAPRPPTPPLADVDPTLTGGAGLFDHSASDPVSRYAGWWAGGSALVGALIVAVALVMVNPAFHNGTYVGTPNQLAKPQAAGGGAALVPGSPEAEGAAIMATKPCGSCHTIPGIPGATGMIGPNLTGVASRAKIAGGAVNNSGPADLEKWIMDPTSLKSGTAMPKVPMTEEEAAKMVAFLETLK